MLLVLALSYSVAVCWLQVFTAELLLINLPVTNFVLRFLLDFLAGELARSGELDGGSSRETPVLPSTTLTGPCSGLHAQSVRVK